MIFFDERNKLSFFRIFSTLVFVGVICGFTYFFGWKLWNLFITPFSFHNTGSFFGFSLVAVSILFLITIGALSVTISPSGLLTDTEAIFRGMFIGFVTGGTVYLSYFSISFPPQMIFYFFIATAIPFLFGGIGAYLQYRWNARQKPSSPDNAAVPVRNRILFSPMKTSIILMVVMIFFSPVIAYAGIWTGLIEKSPRCCFCSDLEIGILRTTNETIQIIQPLKCSRNISELDQKQPYRHWFPVKDPHPPYPADFGIYVDSKEVTNLSVIRAQGLQDTIEPAEGMNDPQFDHTVLSGPDFMENKSHPHLIEVYHGDLLVYSVKV